MCCLLDARMFSRANFCRSQSSNHDSFSKPSPSSAIFIDTNRKGLQKEEAAAFKPVVKAKDNAVNFKEKVNHENMFLVENDDDITGPETPGMQPLTSNVKRSREDGTKLSSLRDSGKRVRFLDDALALDMTKKELEVASKFEWLDPSRIRDANGRRPNDPLYDKTTLYIPPEVMRKMTASQKQYWSVKCKYMDVVLFFKVVSESSTLNIDIFFLYTLWYIYLLLVFFIHYL
jgi:DNA mismatch repair protein MSH6